MTDPNKCTLYKRAYRDSKRADGMTTVNKFSYIGIMHRLKEIIGALNAEHESGYDDMIRLFHEIVSAKDGCKISGIRCDGRWRIEISNITK